MVLGLVKRLSRQGVAVILISHNLNDVFNVADRIAILHLGHLVAAGPRSDFDPPTVVDYMTTGRSWAGMRADVNLMRGDGQATAASAPGVEAEDRQGAEQADPTAAPAGDAAAAAAAPAVLAQSLGDYLQAWKTRIRNAESGMLPVLAGLVAIVIFFQLERSQFLSSANLVNLTVQAAVFVLFAAAEVYVLVLSEVDLSVGFVGGVAAFTTAELIGTNVNAPWWLAILAGFAVGAAIGSLQGTLWQGLSCRPLSSRWAACCSGRG